MIQFTNRLLLLLILAIGFGPASSPAAPLDRKACQALLAEFNEKIIRPNGMKNQRTRAPDTKYGTMGSLLRKMKDEKDAYCTMDVKRKVSESRRTGMGRAGSGAGNNPEFQKLEGTLAEAKEKLWTDLCATYKEFSDFEAARKLDALRSPCRIEPGVYRHLFSELKRYSIEPQGILGPFLKTVDYTCRPVGKKDKNNCPRQGYPRN